MIAEPGTLMKMRTRDRRNICIFVFPFASLAGIGTLLNLVRVLRDLSDSLYLIMGNTGCTIFEKERGICVYEIKHEKGKNPFTRVVNYVLTQLRIAVKITQLRRNVDSYVYFVNSVTLVPIFTAKLLRKDITLVLPASISEIGKARNDIFFKFIRLLEKINYTLSNRIIVYSKGLIGAYSMEKYTGKISLAHQHTIDLNMFNVAKSLSERRNLIGYIGRLSGEKGVLNLAMAIPKVLEKNKDVKFLIIGDGQLRQEIQEYIDAHALKNNAKVLGWIPHKDLPAYLNELKLLVLPSSTEGLPGIILEAMSCGTPVLATPVGGIPDVISDEETGFLLEKNSSRCIAENIIRALSHPNLEYIAKRASALVEKEFTYEIALQQYKKALNSTPDR
jgi:glycosyltransferase involved in cell wall biosynthesis